MKLFLILAASALSPFSSVAFSSPLSANSDDKVASLFLSIVATETQRFEVIEKFQHLNKKFKHLAVISSNDCSNLKPDLVLLVSDKSSDKAEIKAALKKAKMQIPDSYLRECKVKSGSILANDFAFIDASILKLPQDTMSWTFDDIVSQIVRMDKEYSFLLTKKYSGNINDEVEGRKTELYLLNNKNAKRQKLLPQCWDFAEPTRRKLQIAFQCMTETAANQSVHTVYVYDIKHSKMILEKIYCQKPEIKNSTSVVCHKEAVNEFGEMSLTRRLYKVSL